MANFSDRLKELCKTRELKQTDIATFLEVTTRHYQDCEYGRANPNAIMLTKLADYFNVSTDYLLGRSNAHTRY